MLLDGERIDGLRNAGYLIKRTCVVPEIRVVDQAPFVALERTVIGEIETNQGGESAPVGLGNTLADEIALC